MEREQQSVRSGRRVLWTAALTLGLVLCAHSLLETGRDALFLEHVPAERLPWVYLAIAGLALAVARSVGRGARGPTLLRRLVLLQLLAAASVLGFWWGIASASPWYFYALYVWSGVISGAIVVIFWMLLGDLFTITQGKRHFARIAIGGAGGALAGAGLATLIAPFAGGEGLLLAAACFFAASAIGPLSLRVARSPASAAMVAADEEQLGLAAGLRQIVAHPYACRIALLVVLSSTTLTLGDYLFKSVLASEVPAEDLSSWLARIYLGLNALSILMLGIGVNPLVQRLGVDRSLAVLPALTGIATLGVLAGAALPAIVLLKGADGTLRYSLHKTAAELVFLPMASELRSQVKGVIDLVGASAAKALASVGILMLVGTAEPRLAIAGLLLLTSVLWVFAAIKLRGAYLDMFRQTLAHGSIQTRIDYPEMDVASLESLVRGLGDRDERAVLAAMDLLVERGRGALIPSLILYHPSPEVVARAIEIFGDERREHVLDFADRLLDHEYASVRSAIVRTSALLAPDRGQLEALVEAECPCIRVSAFAGLLMHGWVLPAVADREFQLAIVHHERDTRIAVANAARLRYAEIYRESLSVLARDRDEAVAREAVRAMQGSRDAWFTPLLVELLGDRRIRDAVRTALIERGDAALSELARALSDPATPVAVLRHVPLTISRFSSPAAAQTLLRGLDGVRSGMVRYKILRGLQPLLCGPARWPIDKTRIEVELRTTVLRALFLLQHEVALLRGQRKDPSLATAGGKLLVDMVHDKGELATARLFLLLGLLYPDENFQSIQTGVHSPTAARRASGTELIENLLERDLARSILGLVATGDADKRLRRADPDLAAERLGYAGAVQALARDDSESVHAFALYHAGEIAPDDLELGVGSAPAAGRDRSALRDRALEIIERLPEALARRRLATSGAAPG